MSKSVSYILVVIAFNHRHREQRMYKFSLKFIGFFAVFVVALSGAEAVTARPSVVAQAASRMPTLTVQLGNLSKNVTTSTTAANAASCANPAPEQLSAARCISRYNSCLRQEAVCGEHFEICDTVAHFNQKRIYCQDVLSQCPADAFLSLFGTPMASITPVYGTCDGKTTLLSRTFNPTLANIALVYDPAATEQTNQIAQAIVDGNNWAAANAVTTCKNVADACVVKACKGSPQKCTQNTPLTPAEADQMVNIINTGATDVRVDSTMVSTWIANMAWAQSDVKNYMKEQCLEEIGTNKYCHMVVNGRLPTGTQLSDTWEQNTVYEDVMYGATAPRWNANQSKIKEWIAADVVASVQSCAKTATSCAVNACGYGSLAVCYAVAKDANNVVNIQSDATRVQTSCRTPVTNEQSCRDIFLPNGTIDVTDMWTQIWTNDKTGAYASLTKKLGQTFTETSVSRIRSQCQNEVEKCATDACGGQYLDTCFHRDGTTISTLSGENTGGKLDTAMVVGLCSSTVRKSDSCKTYFDMEFAKNALNIDSTSSLSWGTNDYSLDNWYSASAATVAPCTVDTTTDPNNTTCSDQMGQIFNRLISSFVVTAEANYRHKQEVAMQKCLDNNNAGAGTLANAWIIQPGPMTAEQVINGIGNTGQTATSDLFSGICRVQVTMSSSDPAVNDILRNGKSQMFFPMGTTFMCGSNLTLAEMEQMGCIANGDRWIDGQCKTSDKVSGGVKTLATIGGILGGGILGAVGTNALVQNTSVGNIIGARDTNPAKAQAEACIAKVNSDKSMTRNYVVDNEVNRKKTAYSIESTSCTVNGVEYSYDKVTSDTGGTASYDTANNTISGMNKVITQINGLTLPDNVKTDSKSGMIANVVGGVAGAAIATTAAWSIINSVEDGRDDNARKAAKDWMSNVGNKINCMYHGTVIPFGTVATIDW